MAKAEVAVNKRVHDAVLEPQLVTFVPVPVDLPVDVASVQLLRAGVEVIGVVTLLLRLRNQAHHLRHRSIQPRLRDDVDASAAREHRTAGSIPVAAERIENHSLTQRCRATFGGWYEDRVPCRIENLTPEHAAEISAAQIERRDRGQHRVADAFKGP